MRRKPLPLPTQLHLHAVVQVIRRHQKPDSHVRLCSSGMNAGLHAAVAARAFAVSRVVITDIRSDTFPVALQV